MHGVPGSVYDGYYVPGFTLWWLRARDLSAVIDGMLADATFGPRIDVSRIGAAGHSLGGYTVLALAGGIATFGGLRDFCHAQPRGTAVRAAARISRHPRQSGGRWPMTTRTTTRPRR